MSVQAGIWNFDGRPVDWALIASFSESLKQQGPDGEFTYVDGQIAFLYRPFHTSAESRSENQPYISRRGYIVTWDGRLDNREELIADLAGEIRAKPADVEIVAASFDQWETACFSRLIGDWAISIWRPHERELLFASDYMAVRHIFYHLKKDGICWATDLTPLVLLSGERFHIDEDYIAGYFAHQPEAHLTPYRELREVPPGHFTRVRDRKLLAERYWRFNPKSLVRYKTDRDYEEHFRYVFRQAVGQRLRSDSPILAELSGGLDSSSIVCMADNIIANQRTQTPALGTLSYLDLSEPSADDWTYVQLIEQYRNKTGIHIDSSLLGSCPAPFTMSDFVPLPGPLNSWSTFEITRATVIRQGGYRVLLSGIGGDEFMGGIPNPSAQIADLIVGLRLISLAKQLAAWSLVKRKPWIQLFFEALAELLPASLSRHFIKEAKPELWINGAFAKQTKLALRLLGPREFFGARLPTTRSCIAGVLLTANRLAKITTCDYGAAEFAYPYLDRRLIEFVLSIPASQLLRPGERRSLVRRALFGLVPSEVLGRRTKQFMAHSQLLSFDRGSCELSAAFAQPLSSRFGYIVSDKFLQEMRGAKNGKTIDIPRIIRTISLEFWLQHLVARGLLEAKGV